MLLGAAGLLSANDDPLTISDVVVGVGQRLKVGRWTPISFHVSGPAGSVVHPAVSAPDPDGSETTWRLPECTLDGTGAGHVRGLFKIGRLEGRIVVTAGSATAVVPARQAAGADASGCVPRSHNVPFIAVLGRAPGFQTAFVDPRTAPADPGLPPAEIIEWASAGDLPPTHAAYDALDVVVLSQQFDLDAERSAALQEWVRRGGHLVVALGRDPQTFTDGPVSSWLPVALNGGEVFTELASLVGRVPGSPPVNVADGIRGLLVKAAGGEVLASTLGGPLVVRVPYGLGRATVLAVDWSDRRIETWTGLPGLCRYLADMDLPAPESATSGGAQLRPTGISELATQLAAQLDHFGTVARPSYWTIIGFAAAFLLLVGPLDYLLVHRVLKRPRLTWFTFPAWIVFAAAAATLGADRLNSAERQVNQFDLVDLDRTSGLQRVRSWMTLYSSESQRLRVESSAESWLAGSASPATPVSWSGVPESGFGGMYRAGGLKLANPPYSVAENAAAVVNVPVNQWSSKGLESEWSALSADSGDRLVTSDLADDGTGYLVGTLTHRLPDAITHWCVAYGNIAVFPRDSGRADRIPSIPPGVAWRVDDRVNRRQLRHFLQGLTQRYVSKTDSTGNHGSISTTAYDPLELDPFPLARMLSFYDAADGLDYTTLRNDSLKTYDLSRLLPLKRAVLFGRIASPAAEFVVDGTSVKPQEHWTFVRLILPVTPGQAPNLRERGIQNLR